MNKSAIALFILLPLGLVSCTSTGAPSGGVIGLVTGGLLGHLIDGQSNDNNNNNSNSSGLFGGSNNSNNNSSNSSNNGSNALLLGTTTTNSTDPTTGNTTEEVKNQYAVINGNNNNNTDDFFGDNKGAIVGAAAGAISGLVTDSFRKGEIERKYQEGYAKAKSDAIKEFYWLKRDAQKANNGEEAPVQYRYYEVEVPAHVTSDGVMIERHKRVIEVVE